MKTLQLARTLAIAGLFAIVSLAAEVLANDATVTDAGHDVTVATAQETGATEQGGAAPADRWTCEDRAEFREFDFWIGTWEVRTSDGKLAGHNVIEPSQNGCVLLERWTSVMGGTGISMNYLDKTTDEWVQIWLDSSGGQISMRGGPTDDGMALSGEIHYASRGITAPFRGLWTAQADGQVRQFFEQSEDGGATWVPWFEGFYSRSKGSAGGQGESAQQTD